MILDNTFSQHNTFYRVFLSVFIVIYEIWRLVDVQITQLVTSHDDGHKCDWSETKFLGQD